MKVLGPKKERSDERKRKILNYKLNKINKGLQSFHSRAQFNYIFLNKSHLFLISVNRSSRLDKNQQKHGC